MRRLHDESGVALVVAIFISGLMLMAGLAVVAVSDTQTQQTGQERLRENALTLTEGVLNAQANLLSSGWPETADKAFVPCTQTSASPRCPDPGSLLRGYQSKDFGNGAAITWDLSVRDNGLGSFYDDVATATQPAWDRSGPAGTPDGVMWLRARATIRGEARTIVSLIRATPIALAFPRGALTAAHFHTLNNGNKQLLDTGNGPGIMARCTVGPSGPGRGNPCLDYQVDKGQVYPNSYISDPGIPNAMTASELDALRNRAKASGTWFSSCPAVPPNTPLVFIENGPCTFSSGAVINSSANPGMLVVYRGALQLLGGTTFYGLIYAANADNSTDTLVTVTGQSTVGGAIVVDGRGGIAIDGSGLVLQYDSNAFNLVTSTQSINVIANSWRELNGK
ncbi:MAG TPA: hypothetical protein VF715_09050 [Thermoleophilaceae bacterium]|jgi:hypothetical protein